MDPALRDRLATRFVDRLCPDRITLHRATYTLDGRGGQDVDWNVIGTYKARLVNTSDSEELGADAVRPTGGWDCLLAIKVAVYPNDRVQLVGDDTRYWDVIGSDVGQSELLIQRIGLIERQR